MSKAPDAWEDEWSTAADVCATSEPQAQSEEHTLTMPQDGPSLLKAEDSKPSGKPNKAQRRAQQAEFNRQLWAEAEGPKETNYFLESRNIVPLRSEFKPPPILLSRKGPKQQPSRPPTDGIATLQIQDPSSSDDDEAASKQLTLAERQAQAAKDREEKQRKYDERRQELFGAARAVANTTTLTPVGTGRSGNSSPGSETPPQSRSATPNRGGKRGRRGGANAAQAQSRPQPRDLFDPSYTARPDSTYLQRRENSALRSQSADVQPIRAPKGPDGSGRGGFGFAIRGGKATE